MPSEAYKSLDLKLKRAQTLGSVAGLLHWDEQVNLPADSADQRQEQNALLAQLNHEASTDPEIGALLAQLESEDLEEDQKVVIREKRKHYDRQTKLPAEFVDKCARLQSEAYHAWAAARKNDDFASFAPYIQKHIDYSLEYAQLVGWEKDPYDLLIDNHDPGMDAASIDALFSEFRSELAPIVKTILESSNQPQTDIFNGFPISQQEAFLKEVTSAIGFNYQRGRIDISLHPFCSGNASDIRMTTRFDVDNPLDSLFSSIHETGHGLYEQGLPRDQLHNALGQAAGMGVHESQSRLWENQVSRSKAFWKYFEPKFRQAFHEQLNDVSSEALYLAINAVSKCPIRVDSDEVTYNLHIIIRFEIEKKLFSGELKVNELPQYWNNQYKELLDIDVENDANGVLQDIHWSGGAFGYFPSYCLGNMLAAQLWYAALDQIEGLEGQFESGNFQPLLDWLRKNIHQHGSKHYLKELTQKVTGQELSPKSLIRYLKDRYLPLYT
ncbi:MAG: carboxypeptidase M32 [Verrucomicrobiota bacterium]